MIVKKLPYGISDYKRIIEENYIYVDKTEYIEKLENYHGPYIFLLRPRRFGKSLFTSVVANYYDVNEKKNFKKLFGETYIGQNPTSSKNSYYILKFNFSGLTTDTGELLLRTFTDTIVYSFDDFINNYKLDMQYTRSGQPASIFESFLSSAKAVVEKPLYIIIDEYDHFANELLSFQTEMFSNIVSKTGFVRKWYEVLKKGTESIIKRIFATGVSPITIDSLTSGFNIGSDLTRDKAFNEIMGFTEAEVRGLIVDSCEKQLSNSDMEELINVFRKNYNGYLFSERANTRLFNSDMTLYYLKTYTMEGEGPEELIDKNIASDYGKLGKLFNLKNRSRNMDVLESILKGEEIRCSITSQFSLEKDFDEDDFKSLLFYLGMLTIEKSILNRVVMKVPNYVIKSLYFKYFAKKINEAIDYEIDISEVEDAIMAIALDGNNTRLIEVVQKALNKLSNRDYIKFDEKYVKLIFLTYCFLSKTYLVKSEYEVEDGYIDIALLKQANINPTYFALFELKYISKGEYEQKGEVIVIEKKEEGISQIKKYSFSEELASYKNLKKWVIVFVNDKVVVNEEV